MNKRFTKRHRLLVALVVAVALGAGTYAFTATNTVPASYAGSGSGGISGYTVSAVQYTLAAANPSTIDKVAFTLDASATVAKAKLVAASTTYTDCTVTGGTSVSCDFSPDVAVTTADQLSVIAHS
jgi:hypothetical protein